MISANPRPFREKFNFEQDLLSKRLASRKASRYYFPESGHSFEWQLSCFYIQSWKMQISQAIIKCAEPLSNISARRGSYQYHYHSAMNLRKQGRSCICSQGHTNQKPDNYMANCYLFALLYLSPMSTCVASLKTIKLHRKAFGKHSLLEELKPKKSPCSFTAIEPQRHSN